MVQRNETKRNEPIPKANDGSPRQTKRAVFRSLVPGRFGSVRSTLPLSISSNVVDDDNITHNVASIFFARPYTLLYNISEESKGTYGGYPVWAVTIFGWIMCVILPLSFVFIGIWKPNHIERPKDDALGPAADENAA